MLELPWIADLLNNIFHANVSSFGVALPWVLLLLLPWLGLPFIYARLQKQQWQGALRFSQAAVADYLKLNPSPLKRWLPSLLVYLIIFLLIVGCARPTITRMVPTRSVDMMLVIDISLSMKAEDVSPNRLLAARDAGIRFIKSLPDDVKVGLEFFAGNAYVVSTPIADHNKVIALLNSLSLEDVEERTEIGTAIQSALKSLGVLKKADDLDELPVDATSVDKEKAQENAQSASKSQQENEPDKLIVLLSDGDSHEGYPWQRAAKNARDHHVKIHTVAVGRDANTFIEYKGQLYTVVFSEATLQDVADIAEGQYYRAFSEADFEAIYRSVSKKALALQARTEEYTWLFAMVTLFLLFLKLALDAFWTRRLPL